MKTESGLEMRYIATTPSNHASLNHQPNVGVFEGEHIWGSYYEFGLRSAMSEGHGVTVHRGRGVEIVLEYKDLCSWFENPERF